MTTQIFNFTTSSKVTALRVVSDKKLADTLILHLDDELVTAYPLSQFATIYVAMGFNEADTITTINKQMNLRMDEMGASKEDATTPVSTFNSDVNDMVEKGEITVEEYTVESLCKLIDEMMANL